MSAPPLSPPKPGSRAYMALKKLHEIGGCAGQHAWMNAAGWSGPVKSFQGEVISKLVVRGLVYERESTFHITDAGRAALGVDPDAERGPAPALVGSRYVAPRLELSQRHMVRLATMREGSFDYLDIPSLIGNTRLEHQTSLTIAREDSQG